MQRNGQDDVNQRDQNWAAELPVDDPREPSLVDVSRVARIDQRRQRKDQKSILKEKQKRNRLLLL